MKRIIHDPGHGGADPGAVANGLQEKRLTWELALKVKELLAAYDVEQHLIQPSMQNPNVTAKEELQQVTDEANALNEKTPIDLFVSYHINAGGGTGFESYVHPAASEAAKQYRQKIHEKVAAYFAKNGMPDRGMKTANFHVLRETVMPAILLENGFIDSTDAEKLKDAAFMDGLAQAIADGIVAALELSPKTDETDWKEQAEYWQQLYYRENEKVREMEQILHNAASMFAPYMVKE